VRREVDAGAAAMREAGFADVRAVDWNESVTLERGATKLVVHAVPAHHAHDAKLDQASGKGNGYVLEFQGPEGAFVIYWTGDAVLSDEMREVPQRFGRIDILMPHMGAVGSDGPFGLKTLDAEETLSLDRIVSPRVLLPIHHTTFGHYREPIATLEQRMAETGASGRLRVLRAGERYSFMAPDKR
jgi:N-acyl-phosphatidylethanolamine-hydrolysing phospholipase D